MMVPRRVRHGCCRPRCSSRPNAKSEAATRAMDQLEALFKEPEMQTTLVLVATAVDKARSSVQAAAEAGRTIVECGGPGRSRGRGNAWVRTRVGGRPGRPPRSLPGLPRASSRPARPAPTSSRLPRGRRSAPASTTLRADASDGLTMCVGGDRAPRRCRDDWAMTNANRRPGQAGRRAVAARLAPDARRRPRPPEKDPRGKLGWVVRSKFSGGSSARAAVSPGSRRRCSGPIWI